jgi:23S rRNA (guanine745-N1)-methyltransferase
MINRLAKHAWDQLLSCPICSQPLIRKGQVYTCENGHSFDIAREGYVNLLLPQQRRSKDPGYSKQMIVERRDFFDEGHYQPLADELAALITGYLPDITTPVVLDAGCGEGYYLRRLSVVLKDIGYRPVQRCGMDISKHGIRVAAKRDRDGLYAVAGTHHMPIMPQSVDVLLTHFSPVSARDFLHVVKPGGVVLVGGPGEGHLFKLKELIYDNPVMHEPTDSLDGVDGFTSITVHTIRHKLILDAPGQVSKLFGMTPYYWSVPAAVQEIIAKTPSLKTEIDVVVHAYRRSNDVNLSPNVSFAPANVERTEP